jgi:crossover junction endodeoxyribonuclease RuvC
MRLILGIDPGLQHMGWGIIAADGQRLQFVAAGAVHSNSKEALSKRLCTLYQGLEAVLQTHAPHEAAVEETFVNTNAQSTLKLGYARGVALLVPALAGLPVAEYAANVIKKSVTGSGHADKTQMQAMVKMLLPKAPLLTHDAADALAIAITHAHYRPLRHSL